MASVVPNTRQELIAWYAQRAASWASNAANIGLDTSQVTALATLINAAQTTESAAFTARVASRNATVNYHTNADILKEFGAGLVKTIKAYAEATDSNIVYSLASIPPPSKPGPLGAPETPTNVRASLNNNGHIEVKWDGSRAGGTSFRIERNTFPIDGAASNWQLIDVVEERSFMDGHVPQGLAMALYRVIAQRSGGVSVASEPGQVIFGTGSNANSSSGSGGLSLAA
ncbi:MAG: fibronectin type III domain-containing protein [Leptolyngbya sp. PLA3]|nr:MAG: fibronectin type III domain-containing protein [Cyanobacteria bacterium CYA]MCE7968652.1 fibronectin type III domain-containing protein [Leptolyngbya sp. PL-A3]